MGLLISKAFIDPGSLRGCVVNASASSGTYVCLHPGITADELAFYNAHASSDWDVSSGDMWHSGDWLWGLLEVFGLMAVYGYVLFFASNQLSEGSELLLLVPSLAGIVGSVVLPILGAVPDGAIMLFSGLQDNAQEQLSVGVGALAGSTIMLLTIPWGLSILYGAVPLDPTTGDALYGSTKKRARADSSAAPAPGSGGCISRMTTFGVTPDPTIRTNACLMLATALIYLVIQGPAFRYDKDGPSAIPTLAKSEQAFAMAGLVLAMVAFVGYIWLMTKQGASDHSTKEYILNQAAIKQIEGGSPVTLAGVIYPIIEAASQKAAQDGPASTPNSGRLLDDAGKARLSSLLKPFFRIYDVNGDGRMSALELRDLLRHLGEDVRAGEDETWMRRLDPDQSGVIERELVCEPLSLSLRPSLSLSLRAPPCAVLLLLLPPSTPLRRLTSP
jgi:Ca2+/Na+ antiporter